ncbi:MAG: tRNA (adenosine(37)-N6)-threonylcarbamoyltransferase complex dimerization subunit type 1 TsaB [Myxococcota bacterium]|nr:tRNA (adenosine(37)-N6)-threonylcarbamoyltransferase complex dimerization subunit type 1 TsaB [Myxococcota bacterium]
MKGVLAIDTAGPVVGLGFYNSVQSSSWEKRVVRGAVSYLLPKMAAFAERYDIGWVAVSTGPGAFTGLRVGVAAAIGFALARGLDVIPLSSLMIRAAMTHQKNTLALLDARKGRVYAQLFDADGEIPLAASEAVDAEIKTVLPKEKFLAVGEGAERYRSILEESGALIPLDAFRSPVLEAAKIAWLLRDSAQKPLQISLDYIRPPDAVVPKNLGRALGHPQEME